MPNQNPQNLGNPAPNTPLGHVQQAYRASKNVQQVELNRFARYYGLYRGRQLDRNYRGLARLFIPEAHRIVARKTAKIVNSIRKILVTPRGENDIEKARIATIMMNYLGDRLNVQNVYRSIIKESRIVSMAWAKVTWDKAQEQKGEQWRGFRIDQFSVDRIFVPPAATLLDMFMGRMEYLIAEYETDISELEKNKNYDQGVIAKIKAGGGSLLPQTVLSQQRQINRQGQAEGQSPFLNKKHYVQEYWGKFSGEDRIIVVVDNNHVIRNDANPYAEILSNPIPFVPFPASIEPHEQYPIGDIEPNESLFNELNDTRNQRMDTVTLNIDPAKIVLRSAQIDEKELIAKRGWVVHSNVPNGIQFVPPDMQGVRAAIDEEKIIRGDIQQSTGVLDFAPQSDLQAGINIDTARGAIIAKGEADVMTAEEIDITKQSLQMFWRIILALAQTFLDENFVMRVVESGKEQFIDANNEAIAGQLDVDIDIETLQDETTRQTTSIMLLNQARETAGANIGKFFTDTLLTFKDDVNIDEYYQAPQPPPPEVPKVSISLKGDLTGMQAAQIYKTLPNVDPIFADPITVPEGRAMMDGSHGAMGNLDQQAKQLEILKAQKDILDAHKTSAETTKIRAETDKLAAETADILTRPIPSPDAKPNATNKR